MRLILGFWVFVSVHLGAGETFLNQSFVKYDSPIKVADRPQPPLPPPRPPLLPRPRIEPADDAVWDKCGAKGCTLRWGMQTTDAEAGALFVPRRLSARSLYSSTADLYKWVWDIFPRERVDDSFHDFYRTWGIGWALAGLGLDAYTDEFGGKNRMLHVAHQSYEAHDDPNPDKQTYTVNDKLYRSTGASYSFTINTEEGIIISLNRESPKWAAKDRDPPVPLDQQPELNQFSDVAWITWKYYAGNGDGIKNIKYFLSSMITNMETKQVLKRAHEANRWVLEDWPGHIFKKAWPETKAILGTPNVQGFAYFLIQHKMELGNMYIDKIQVFSGETAHEKPCILMHVKQFSPISQNGELQRRDKSRNILQVNTWMAKL